MDSFFHFGIEACLGWLGATAAHERAQFRLSATKALLEIQNDYD